MGLFYLALFAAEKKHTCPYCRSIALRRENRKSRLQDFLALWFHIYPWECALCRRVSLHKRRS